MPPRREIGKIFSTDGEEIFLLHLVFIRCYAKIVNAATAPNPGDGDMPVPYDSS